MWTKVLIVSLPEVFLQKLIYSILELSQNLNVVLELDTLSMVYKDTKLNNLYDILVESAIRCLWLLRKPLLQQFSKDIGDHTNINQFEIYHFYPEGCGHFISRVYNKNCDEATLSKGFTLILSI